MSERLWSVSALSVLVVLLASLTAVDLRLSQLLGAVLYVTLLGALAVLGYVGKRLWVVPLAVVLIAGTFTIYELALHGASETFRGEAGSGGCDPGCFSYAWAFYFLAVFAGAPTLAGVFLRKLVTAWRKRGSAHASA